MDNALHAKLLEHYQQKEFDQIIKITDYCMLKEPTDFGLRYCAAIACLYKQDAYKALTHISRMLDAYQAMQQRGTSISVHARRLAGHGALQLVLLSGFYRNDIAYDFFIDKSAYGLTVARQIARDIGDRALAKETEAIAHCFVPWQRTDCHGQRVSGVGYIPDSPYVLQVEPTNHCNISCRMCPRKILLRDKGFMEEPVWERILQTWSSRTRILRIPHLVFQSQIIAQSAGILKFYFMGEPLLHPQFDAFIRKAKESGVETVLQTNGILLANAAIRRRLLTSQPNIISFSIDGISSDSYEFIRRGSRWKDILKAVQALHADRSALGLSDSIKIYIASIIPDYDDKAVSAEYERFISPLKPYVDTIGMKPLSKQCFGEFVDREGNSVRYDPSADPQAPASQPLCSEIFEKMNILWDGTIIPCCYDVDAKIPLGSVLDGIDAVWQNDKTSALRLALSREDLAGYSLCRQCKGISCDTAKGPLASKA